MNIHERLAAFWSGEKPDRIPTIYQNEWRHTQNDPAWIPLFEAGLGVTYQVPLHKTVQKNIEYKRNLHRRGTGFTRTTIVTPVGNFTKLKQKKAGPRSTTWKRLGL